MVHRGPAQIDTSGPVRLHDYFPPLQRLAETALAHLTSEITNHPADYSYGPFLVNTALLGRLTRWKTRSDGVGDTSCLRLPRVQVTAWRSAEASRAGFLICSARTVRLSAHGLAGALEFAIASAMSPIASLSNIWRFQSTAIAHDCCRRLVVTQTGIPPA